MNTDNFESRLQRQPLRQAPPEWRAEILAAARAVASEHATRNTQQASPLSALRDQLVALLWPRPLAWAGLAAIWLLILGLNASTPAPTTRLARRTAPPSPQVFMAFQEQARLLAELIGPRDIPAAVKPRTGGARPRSERSSGFALA